MFTIEQEIEQREEKRSVVFMIAPKIIEEEETIK
jgi:hypothetical protein